MSSEAEGKFRRTALFALKLCIAALLVWWIISCNSEGLREVFRNFDYRFLFPALGGYIAHMLISAWRWYALAKALDFALSPWQALSLTFQGYFFTLFIPAGAIGGDFVRIAFLAHSSPAGTRRDGAVTVLVDRMVGMASLFVLAMVLIVVNFREMMDLPLDKYPWLAGIRPGAIAVLFLICLAGNMAIVILFAHKFLRKLPGMNCVFKIINRFSGNFFDRLTNALDTYRTKWMLLVKTFIVSVFGVHLMLAAGVWLMTFGIENAAIPPMAVANAVTIGNIAGLLPSFSGIGFRDVTIEVLLSGCCQQAIAAAVPLCFTVTLLLGNLSGGIFFVADASGKRGR